MDKSTKNKAVNFVLDFQKLIVSDVVLIFRGIVKETGHFIASEF